MYQGSATLESSSVTRRQCFSAASYWLDWYSALPMARSASRLSGSVSRICWSHVIASWYRSALRYITPSCWRAETLVESASASAFNSASRSVSTGSAWSICAMAEGSALAPTIG